MAQTNALHVTSLPCSVRGWGEFAREDGNVILLAPHWRNRKRRRKTGTTSEIYSEIFVLWKARAEPEPRYILDSEPEGAVFSTAF
jgi:hypothetical protein